MFGQRTIREAILADRAALRPDERRGLDAALTAAALAYVAVSAARTVAAYVPLADEPGGAGLAEALAAQLPPAGLLLPAMRPDRDLDWVAYAGQLSAGAAVSRLREPPGPRLGADAITTAEIVFVPALAVDRTGTRLGRGGGSYDRALARLPAGVPVIALLFPGELVPTLPSEAHDRPVSAVLTAHGLTLLG